MLEELLARGRRRLLATALLSGVSLAVCVFLGGFVLVLVLGTHILNWWVPVSVGLAALVFVLVQMIRNSPTETQVAHTLDEGSGLSDTLTTAVHFRRSNLGAAEVQRRQAEQAAGRIEFAVALPYARPRSLPLLTGLALTAGILFFVRYGVTHTLALGAPIVPFGLDAFAPDPRTNVPAANRKPGTPKSPPANVLNRLGNSTPDNPNAEDLQGRSASAVTSAGRENQDGLNGAAADGKKDGSAGQSADASDSNANPAKEGGDQSPSSRDGDQQGAQAASKTPSSSASSGLMSKLKDAVSSLMAKMKPQGGQTPQNGSKQESQQQANAKQQQGQQGAQKQGQQGDKGSPSQQEGDESSASDSDQSAPGQGKGKSSDQNAAAKPGSGMGHQDGSKELQDAEQMAAMGKLSEIIGKRSASITGEMTIESQSGPQQLKTGYTHSTAKHGESGGDVSRDEVPVALQGYVQQYFEQAREQAAVKTARAGKQQSQP